MNTPSFSRPRVGSYSRTLLLLSSFLALSVILSCKGEFDDKKKWSWDGEKPKTELDEWSYTIDDETTDAWWITVLSDNKNGGTSPNKKADKLWPVLEEHVTYGQERAGSDFYTEIYNARNNQDSYKAMRLVMEWIMDRVEKSVELQVWFDQDIDKWEVFEYSDINDLHGTLKIWTSVDAGVQYVKIIFSPIWEKWAYNIWNAWYWFSGDVHMSCSRPVNGKSRKRQYTLWVNQEEMTPGQVKEMIEQLLYGWRYVMR